MKVIQQSVQSRHSRRGSELSGITDNNVDEEEPNLGVEDFKHNNSHHAFLVLNKLQAPQEPSSWKDKARPIDSYDVSKRPEDSQGKS